jgi:hypothetical protein
VPLAHLVSLDLRRADLSPEGCDVLAEVPWFSRLRALRLGGIHLLSNSWYERAAALVRRALPRLEVLDLSHCNIGLQAIQRFTDPAPRLRTLLLAEGVLRAQGGRGEELIASPLFDKLESLDLASCQLSMDALNPLLKSGKLKTLRTLNLSNNQIFGLPRLAHLAINGGQSQYREIKSNQITDWGLQGLAGSKSMPQLARLELRRNALTAKGIKWLVESPLLERLYYLDLRENRLGDRGADLLARRGPWPRLAWLNLRQCGISPAARSRLIQSFGFRVLV